MSSFPSSSPSSVWPTGDRFHPSKRDRPPMICRVYMPSRPFRFEGRRQREGERERASNKVRPTVMRKHGGGGGRKWLLHTTRTRSASRGQSSQPTQPEKAVVFCILYDPNIHIFGTPNGGRERICMVGRMGEGGNGRHGFWVMVPSCKDGAQGRRRRRLTEPKRPTMPGLRGQKRRRGKMSGLC